MSTPQPTSGNPPAEKDKSRRRSIQRFVSKLVRGRRSEAAPTGESSSAAAAAATTATTTVAAPSTAPPPPPAEAAVVSEVPAVLETPATPVVTTPTPEVTKPVEAAPEVKETPAPEVKDTPAPEVKDVPAPVLATRPTIPAGAKQLAEKHGIEITEDWPYAARPPAGKRVEKPIRMRVRRYCHVCQVAFGSEKACPNCDHKRCVDCPRSPAAKEKKKKTKYKEFNPYEGLTRPSKTGGQDLVYRKIRQRVHYKCHKCDTDFGGQKTCGKCSHNRCKKCHREPNRKPKPVEEVVVKRKKPIKWTCSECHTPSNITKKCTQCNHSRCVDCIREISKKKKPIRVGDPTSDTDTQEQGIGTSAIDKVATTLAATSIAS